MGYSTLGGAEDVRGDRAGAPHRDLGGWKLLPREVLCTLRREGKDRCVRAEGVETRTPGRRTVQSSDGRRATHGGEGREEAPKGGGPGERRWRAPRQGVERICVPGPDQSLSLRKSESLITQF